MKPNFVSEDYIIIAVDPLSRFAIRFACLNNAIHKTLEIHKVQGDLTRALSEFTIGTVLIGSRSDEQESYLYKLKFSQCPLTINCEVSPRGLFRVAVFPPEKQSSFCLPLAGIMEACRLKRDDDLYQSLSQIEAVGVEATLQNYLQLSLQRDSLITLNADNETIQKNFGLWVEKLPDTHEHDWQVFARRFATAQFFKESFASSNDPDQIMGKLFPEGFRILAVTRPRFECNCNKERLISALGTLPEKDLVEIFMEGKGITTICDYCRKEWFIADTDIKGLIKSSASVH